jgi:phage-related tail fiber protein
MAIGDKIYIPKASDVTDGVPVGTVIPFAKDVLHNGYLECDGTPISRDTYSALFAFIGTHYGDGDGSTTFNLPDLRGEFIRGWDNGRGVDVSRNIGTSQAEEVEPHNHSASSNSTGSHSHDIYERGSDNCGLGSLWSVDRFRKCDDRGPSRNGTILSSGSHSHTITVDNSTGTETRPRNIALMYCIKY